MAQRGQRQEALFGAETGSLAFAVELDVFSGPFDVLLSLIAKHKLDITEIALAEVTDEFLEHARARAEMDLSQASEFLVIAATLLALKAARLLPSGEADEEDLELLEARDLLFAKLLQYKAFKDLAMLTARRMAENSLAVGRDLPLDPEYATLVPKPQLHITVEELRILAAAAMARAASDEPTIALAHLHDPLVPVHTQVELLTARLTERKRASFGELCADAPTAATVVSRFLAVLELMRAGQVSIRQDSALADLWVTWGKDTDDEPGE